jgi:hypothetical protein
MNGRISFTVAVGIALLAFAAPANAKHVACGDTLTTDTVLDGDIVCADTDFAGLVIGASGITVWFQGHKLSSPTPDSRDTGITTLNNNDYDNVTIRGGGTIEGFFEATRIRGSDVAVRRMTVPTDCANGIIIEGDRAKAYRNTVTLRYEAACQGHGIYIGQAAGTSGTDSEAWGNTVTGSANAVVVVGPNARAVLNSASNCGTGIFVGDYDGTHAVASINTVTGCGTGIANRLNTDAQSGNGRFRRNVVTGTFGGHGMLISDSSAIIGRNTVTQAGIDGIHTLTAGTLIQNNTANDNAGYGINAFAPGGDGGGNTATGNLAPEGQCRNVSCGP